MQSEGRGETSVLFEVAWEFHIGQRFLIFPEQFHFSLLRTCRFSFTHFSVPAYQSLPHRTLRFLHSAEARLGFKRLDTARNELVCDDGDGRSS